MDTFRDGILETLDSCRGIRGQLGLNSFIVTVRVRTYDGERPGIDGQSDVDTVLVNRLDDVNSYNPMVRQLSRKEVIASGGLYTDRDLKVGPITPPYPEGILMIGGFNDATMDPPPTDSAVEIYWNISGSGYPAGGGWYEKVGEETTDLHTYVILRSTGRQL